MTTQKSKSKAIKTYEQRTNVLFEGVFKDRLENIKTWNRKKEKGFTTMPRCIPIITLIMDYLSNGKPLSQTYLSLWFRATDSGYVQVKDERELAFESGFNGERSASTWRQRMRKLKEIGFILAEEGVTEFEFTIIKDPFIVIKELNHDGKIKDKKYINALLKRVGEVGSEFKLD